MDLNIMDATPTPGADARDGSYSEATLGNTCARQRSKLMHHDGNSHAENYCCCCCAGALSTRRLLRGCCVLLLLPGVLVRRADFLAFVVGGSFVPRERCAGLLPVSRRHWNILTKFSTAAKSRLKRRAMLFLLKVLLVVLVICMPPCASVRSFAKLAITTPPCALA